MKKAIRFLNNVMGSFVGVFVGRTAGIIWSYFKRPERFAANSSPWYTETFMHAGFTVIFLSICLIIKGVLIRINRKTKKQSD